VAVRPSKLGLKSQKRGGAPVAAKPACGMWQALADVGCSPPLKLAEVSFLRGDYVAALREIFAAPDDARKFLLSAHIAYRMRHRDDALAFIATARNANFLRTHQDWVLARAIEAASLASLGREAEARRALGAIQLPSMLAPAVDAEIAYYAASCAWMLCEYELAAGILDRIDATFDPNIEARFELLRGWMHAAREDYQAQLRCCLEAAELLECNATPDVGLLALIVRTASALTRDMACVEAIPVLMRLETWIPWTPSMALEHFQTVRTLAWANAMAGEYIAAIRQLNRAKALAPNAQSRMLSHLDHAWIARISNEPLHLRAELSEADACAAEVDWGTTSDEEVGALILAAELYASVDVERGAEYLAQADGARGRMSRWLGFGHDRRLGAFYDFAEAVLRVARGDRRMGRHRARRAYEVFASVGYRWRAANGALVLYHLTGDDIWINRLDEVARDYPRSFLAAEVERSRAVGRSPMELLTARQREIVELIKRGLKNSEVARELRMSANTVRIHKGRIFRAFGVTNEFELLKRLTELDSAA